jgi:hypothetical protein
MRQPAYPVQCDLSETFLYHDSCITIDARVGAGGWIAWQCPGNGLRPCSHANRHRKPEITMSSRTGCKKSSATGLARLCVYARAPAFPCSCPDARASLANPHVAIRVYRDCAPLPERPFALSAFEQTDVVTQGWLPTSGLARYPIPPATEPRCRGND